MSPGARFRQVSGRRRKLLDHEPGVLGCTQIKEGGEGMPAFGSAFQRAEIQSIAAFVSRSTRYSAADD